MDSRRIVFMFSGQGSQYHGMGRGLFEADPIFRHELTTLDAHARRLTGESVLETFLRADVQAPFTRLSHTHPAVYMVEIALARRLMHEGIKPDCVLGASLGEFAALVTAGTLTAEDALRIVIGHAAAVERHCVAGGMLAVLDAPELFEREPSLFAETWLAAIHFDGHFVISGGKSSIARAEQRLKTAGIVAQRLPVDYAFHSPLVSPADAAFTSLAASVVWRRPRCRVVSCAAGGLMSDPLPSLASGITAKPIQFSRAAESLEAEGPCIYIDLGPSGTLATFLKYLLPKSTESTVHRTLSARGKEVANVERVVSALRPPQESDVQLRARSAPASDRRGSVGGVQRTGYAIRAPFNPRWTA